VRFDGFCIGVGPCPEVEDIHGSWLALDPVKDRVWVVQSGGGGRHGRVVQVLAMVVSLHGAIAVKTDGKTKGLVKCVE
jgi:hypothetical protein